MEREGEREGEGGRGREREGERGRERERGRRVREDIKFCLITTFFRLNFKRKGGGEGKTKKKKGKESDVGESTISSTLPLWEECMPMMYMEGS